MQPFGLTNGPNPRHSSSLVVLRPGVTWSNAARASAKLCHGELTDLLPLECKTRQPVLSRTTVTQTNNCQYNFFTGPTRGLKMNGRSWRESNSLSLPAVGATWMDAQT